MSDTRIIAKDEEMIYSVLADAEITEYTYVAGFHLDSQKWFVESLAMWLKWVPYFDAKEYNESMEVPAEIVKQIKRKQKEYAERHAHPQAEGS